MHRLADGIVSAKRKGNIADPAAHARPGEILFNPARRLDEVDCVIAMLLETSRDREDIGVENDVVRGKPGVLGQQFVSARADLSLALNVVRLAALVERHHDHRRAVAPNHSRLPEKFLLAVFQADGIDDRFTLHAFEARFDHAPLRAVDHHRDARDFRFAADQVQKACHGRFRIDHSLVHVYVEEVRPALHLLTRHRQRAFEIVGQDQFREFRGAGDIGPFTNNSKPELGCDLERLKPGQL